MAKLTGHVVSHTHWDRAWYWTFEETRSRLLDLMDDLLDLMEREPRYRRFVLDGQMAMVEDYLALRPERRPQLARLARAGRLLLGPFFVLPDLFIPSAESLIRNLERGLKLASTLGPVMRLGYLPDPFGHPAQLPQLLAGFGIDGILLARGLGDEGEELGADFFWQAPEGSSILATHQVGGYCNFARLGGEGSLPEQIERALQLTRRRVEEMRAACPHGQLLLGNGCDHLPAQPELPLLLQQVNRRCGEVQLRHSTPLAYQAAVRAAIKAGRFRPGTHRGELRGSRYANLLSGVLSARVDLKLAHHAVELELLRWVEPLQGLCRALGRGRDDQALLEEAWRLLLLCQPHDDICGCSIDGVHDDDQNRLARAGQLARRLGERALTTLFAPPAVAPAAWVGLNPHPWPTRSLLFLPGWQGGVRSEAGELPVQRVRGGMLVEAPLPALGWSGLVASKPARPSGSAARIRMSGSVVRLQNQLVEVELSRTGQLRLHDLRTGLRCAGELVDEGDAGDTYDFSPPRRQQLIRGGSKGRLRVLEAGPLRTAAELQLTLSLPVGLSADRSSRSPRRRQLPVRLRLWLRRGSPLVELELRVENTVDEHRLRAAFRLPLRLASVQVAAPLQVLERPTALPSRPGWQQPPSPTVPVQGFVAGELAGRGLAVLAPGLRELEARPRGPGTELLITLLRSVSWLSRDDLRTRSGHAGPGLRVEGARQLEPIELRLGLLPYAGSWLEAEVPRLAEEHAAPARVLPVESAPPPRSFLELGAGPVVLSALRAGPGGDLQARVVNLAGHRHELQLGGELVPTGRLRLDGSPLRGKPSRSLRSGVRLGPGEIVTLALALPAGAARTARPGRRSRKASKPATV